MPENHQIRNFGAFADLIGDQSHIEMSGVTDAFLFTARGEIFENGFAPLLEDFSHLAREIQIRFEAEGAGDIVKESAFDRDRIDNMLAEKCATKFLGNPNGIIERCFGMFRTIQRDKNVFDHADLLTFAERANVPAPFELPIKSAKLR